MAIGDIRIGAVFPHFALQTSEDIRSFATAVHSLGFDHLYVYDHVAGGSPKDRPELQGRYTSDHNFHEVFVLFGYLAALVPELELVSGVLILPQRQTVLVAKQAAELSLLTNGKFRLGVGIGWNQIEYQVLNENFRNRGRRLEEQIEVLRALFAERVVRFEGRYHTIDRAGIQPSPVGGHIPIWIGGSSEIAVRRAARIGDGFFPNQPKLEDDARNLKILRDELQRVGRDADSFGLEPRINLLNRDHDDWKRRFTFWRELGATHLTLATIVQPGPDSPDHAELLAEGLHVLSSL